MPELLGLPYSPWSEKARWALEARGISYAKRLYQPLLGEPGLRKKLGKWRGTVSVPVLTTDDGEVIADSAAIARWADHHGSGPTLFPAEHDAAIVAFDALAERGMAIGRALSLTRLLDEPAGIAEMVPRSLRSIPGARWIAKRGVARTRRKYRGETDPLVARAQLAGVLDELRASRAGRPTLLGTFTFADIAATQILAFVEPPAFGLKLGDGTRRSFIDDELRARFADLVTWRDGIYQHHRPQPER
jgi:glutathione S-transferase